MKLTVLGKSPAWQDAGGACSGYLLEQGGRRLLVDCGNGVFAKLREACDYIDVDAIVISHLHADHFMDLVPYSFALIHAPRQQPVPVDRWPGTDDPARPALYGPPGSCAVFKQVAGALQMPSLIEDAFAITEYDPARELDLDPFSIEFKLVPHFVETYAMSLRSRGAEGRIAYGADCRPNRALVALASGAEILIAEATLPRPERTGVRGHLTPAEAGQHAEAAGAGQLVLSHISDELDPEWARREAASEFGGEVKVAFEGMQLEL